MHRWRSKLAEWVGGGVVVGLEYGRAAETALGAAGRRFESGHSCQVSRNSSQHKEEGSSTVGLVLVL